MKERKQKERSHRTLSTQSKTTKRNTEKIDRNENIHNERRTTTNRMKLATASLRFIQILVDKVLCFLFALHPNNVQIFIFQ